MTRRDFINATLAGSGSQLVAGASPRASAASAAAGADWDGPGGAGDYAECHGNPWKVIADAHKIRDGEFRAERLGAEDTGEMMDLIVIGGGVSGLGAALHFTSRGKRGQTCLLLDAHPVFGGKSKRNEMVVDGQKLMGPQAANEFDIPTDPSSDAYEIFEQLKIPRRFDYQAMPEELRRFEFDRTNYGFQHWLHAPSFGTHVDGRWVRDFWDKHAPKDLRRWKYDTKRYYDGDDYQPWLDSMTYKTYIEKVMGYPKEVTSYADPILAAAMGLGCDGLSAYAASQIDMPGFAGLKGRATYPLKFSDMEETGWQMFPGGNAGFARYFVKTLVPAAIEGSHTLNDVVNGRIRFHALDKPGQPVRLRLFATVVRVDQNDEYAEVTYLKDRQLYRVRGRGVVMASGSWTSKHIVRGLPDDKREAFEKFTHSAVLVFNVGVTNWRFLYDLGITSARWTSGFGFSCNIRRQMVTSGYQPKFSPDSPTMVTFYVPLFYPGLSAKEQGVKGRYEIFTTPFADYEQQLRDQIRKLFGGKAAESIAGIILNRWGHAFVNPAPGFYFGQDGKPSPPDVIREPLGRITFAHAELQGHQFWLGGIREGRRAVDQLRKITSG